MEWLLALEPPESDMSQECCAAAQRHACSVPRQIDTGQSIPSDICSLCLSLIAVCKHSTVEQSHASHPSSSGGGVPLNQLKLGDCACALFSCEASSLLFLVDSLAYFLGTRLRICVQQSNRCFALAGVVKHFLHSQVLFQPFWGSSSLSWIRMVVNWLVCVLE